jgi:hypothetical protein
VPIKALLIIEIVLFAIEEMRQISLFAKEVNLQSGLIINR